MSRDPIVEAGGLNLYRYVDNDPVDLIDFNGLSFGEWIKDLIGKKVRRPISPAGVVNKVIWVNGPKQLGSRWRLASSDVELTIVDGKVCRCSRICKYELMMAGAEDEEQILNVIDTKTGRVACDAYCPAEPWW